MNSAASISGDDIIVTSSVRVSRRIDKTSQTRNPRRPHSGPVTFTFDLLVPKSSPRHGVVRPLLVHNLVTLRLLVKANEKFGATSFLLRAFVVYCIIY